MHIYMYVNITCIVNMQDDITLLMNVQHSKLTAQYALIDIKFRYLN